MMNRSEKDEIDNFRRLLESYMRRNANNVNVQATLSFINGFIDLNMSNEGQVQITKMALIAAINELKRFSQFDDHDGLWCLYRKVLKLSNSFTKIKFCEWVNKDEIFPRNINFWAFYAEAVAEKGDADGFTEIYEKVRRNGVREEVDEKFMEIANTFGFTLPTLEEDVTINLFSKKAKKARRSSLAALQDRVLTSQHQANPRPNSLLKIRNTCASDVSLEEYVAAKWEDEHQEVGDCNADMDKSIVMDIDISDEENEDMVSTPAVPSNVMIDDVEVVRRNIPAPLMQAGRGNTPTELTPIQEIVPVMHKAVAVPAPTRSPAAPLHPRRPTAERLPVEALSPASAPSCQKRSKFGVSTPHPPQFALDASVTSNFYDADVFSSTVNLQKGQEQTTSNPLLNDSEIIVPKKMEQFEVFCDADSTIPQVPPPPKLFEDENAGAIRPRISSNDRRPLGVREVQMENEKHEEPNDILTEKKAIEHQDVLSMQQQKKIFTENAPFNLDCSEIVQPNAHMFEDDEMTVAGAWKNFGGDGIVTSTPMVNTNNRNVQDIDFFAAGNAATDDDESDEDTVPADDPFKIVAGTTAFGQRRMSIQKPARKSLGVTLTKSTNIAPVDESVSNVMGKMQIKSPIMVEQKEQDPVSSVAPRQPFAPLTLTKPSLGETTVPVTQVAVKNDPEPVSKVLPAAELKKPTTFLIPRVVPTEPEVDLDSTGIGLPAEMVTSKFNPWGNEERSMVMKDFQAINAYEFTENCPRISLARPFSAGGMNFQVQNLLGQGGFAKVFKAINDEEKHVALKYEIPNCMWEVFICDSLKKRLNHDNAKLHSIMVVEDAFLYPNASVIVNEFVPYGNLLDLSNKYHEPNWQIVVLLGIHIARILRDVHNCQIVHGDVKPDNFMVLGKINESANLEEVLNSSTVRLIDFGRAIDLQPLKNMTFTGRAGTECFDCTEMMDGRPWNYQGDFFGFVGTLNVLFFNKYVTTKVQNGKTIANCTFKRRNNARMLMLSIYDELLNIPNCEKMPSWDGIIARLSELLRSQHDLSQWREAVRTFNQSLSHN